MLRSTLLVVALGAIVALSSASGIAYDGYKIFEVVPQTQEQLDFLFDLSKYEEFYDFLALKKIPNHVARVMVNPNEEENFLTSLDSLNLSYRVLNENVGKTIEREFQLSKLKRNLAPFSGKGRLSTERYYSHAEINAYIEDLAERYPERVVVQQVGKSYEGRDMKTITITNGDGRKMKNVIFMDGGFHAREWISPAAVLYVIEQLVENFEENAELLADYDWVILPMVNPDGYEHTQTGTLARMWRKTRQPYTFAGKTCYGADPNRNFGFHWNEEGASNNPCVDTYAGPKAFSENETIIVRDLMHSLRGRGVMYLTIHSYGNYLLYPWGWTSDLPDTWPDLDEVARAGGDAIYEATGTVYSVGSATNVLYVAAGASDDYAFYAGFPISITMELPGGGLTGFDPPASKIDPYVKETWIGIRAMAKKVVEKYPTERPEFL
ncbi:carboxypeptidase B1-like [Musca vetustissima]|uniref:carboxypeptidase B1-like n=1 Tax=Musca vetustissima TaxID=27455 RepID=UPI002AB7D184|nr:carboxypeptidase B1-like [Musca vetustissima]